MGSFTGCFTLFHALHIHQLAQIAKDFVVLRLGDGLFLQKGIQGFLLIPEQSDLLPTFLRHQVGMYDTGDGSMCLQIYPSTEQSAEGVLCIRIIMLLIYPMESSIF